MTQEQKENNTYILDTESTAEMTRLLEQDRMGTEMMGGIFPEKKPSELESIVDVLDIACGPGGWAMQVARAYPEMDVTGIDISALMLNYARTHARVRGLSNVNFQIMDITKSLAFPDASFDLVNARTICAVLFRDAWKPLLQECRRILRPGGTIRLTEGDEILSNKPGFETFFGLISKVLFQRGYSFSPTGRHIGIVPMLKPLLTQVGFTEIQYRTYGSDVSFGTPAYPLYYQDLRILLKVIQPLLINAKLATQKELDALYEQTLEEMQSPDFYAFAFGLTVWGIQPEE